MGMVKKLLKRASKNGDMEEFKLEGETEEPFSVPEGLFDTDDETEPCVGVVIHFLPHMINVYICDDTYIVLDGGVADMVDLEDNYIGVSGNVISVAVPTLNDVAEVKARYRLAETGLPINEIKVREY